MLQLKDGVECKAYLNHEQGSSSKRESSASTGEATSANHSLCPSAYLMQSLTISSRAMKKIKNLNNFDSFEGCGRRDDSDSRLWSSP